MRSHLIGAIALGIVSPIASAQATFRSLGIPPGYDESHAFGVSTDGRTIVGAAYTITASSEDAVALRWDRDSGAVTSLSFSDLPNSEAWAISADGSTIVGMAWDATTETAVAVAWRNGIAETLEAPPGAAWSCPAGVSADGTVIVAFAATCWDCTPHLGFWWRGDAVYPLPSLPSLNDATPFSLTASGLFVVGSSSGTAVLWRLGDNSADVVSTETSSSWGYAASDDGRTVLGLSGLPDTPCAFRWTEGSGAITLNCDDLFDASLRQVTCSVDASAIAISDHFDPTKYPEWKQCFLWTPAGGMRNVAALLESYGVSTGTWTLGEGDVCLSGDARTIAGTGRSNDAGSLEAWVATLPPEQVCYANCDVSSTPPVLNVADFTCFLQRYAAGDEYANCDQSTAPPILNVADFTCFLQKFAAGCH